MEHNLQKPKNHIEAVYSDVQIYFPDVKDIRDFPLLIGIEGTDGNCVKLQFERYLFYSRTNESWAPNTISMLLSAVQPPFHWLYRVTNSPLLKTFKKANPQLNPKWEVVNFVIVTIDDVIDVLSVEDPILWRPSNAPLMPA